MIREFHLTSGDDTLKYAVGSFGANEPTLMRDLMKELVCDDNDDSVDCDITGFEINKCFDLDLVYYEYTLHFSRNDEDLCATYRGSDVGLITFDQRSGMYSYHSELK